MTSPFFTILTAVLNRRDYIERMLAGVAAQNADNFEIVIADNGSDDGTFEYISQLQWQNLKVVRNESRGKAFALNEGLKVAEGQWVLILDSDNQLIAPDITAVLEGMIGQHTGMTCFLTRNVGLSGDAISHPTATNRAITIEEYDGQRGEFSVIYKADVIRAERFPEVAGCRTEFPAIPVQRAAIAGSLCTLDVVAQIYDTTPTDRISHVELTPQVMRELFQNYRMVLEQFGPHLRHQASRVLTRNSLRYAVYGRMVGELSLRDYLRSGNYLPWGAVWLIPRALLEWLLVKARRNTEAQRV